MAPKAHQEAAKKKAAKQKKRLMILAVPLLGALVYAYTTLSSLGAAPAGATPPAATTPAGTTPAVTAPVVVTPGIDAPPAGTLYSFSTLGQKDPFYDDGPNKNAGCSCATSSSSSPNYTSSRTTNPPIADQSGSTSKSTATTHDAGLNAAVLKASQVGPGYQVKTGAASTRVSGTVTLDICGYGFKSEMDRTARLQDIFVKPEVGLLLSNEVVRYKTGGTALAMHELAQAVATCPHHPIANRLTGQPMTWRIHRITAPNLLPGAMALSIQVTSTNSKGQDVTVTGFGIYQTRGTILSGVYLLLPPGSNMTTSQAQAFAIHLAQTSASNMKKVAAH